MSPWRMHAPLTGHQTIQYKEIQRYINQTHDTNRACHLVLTIRTSNDARHCTNSRIKPEGSGLPAIKSHSAFLSRTDVVDKLLSQLADLKIQEIQSF